MDSAPDADAPRARAEGRLALVPFRGLRFARAKVGDPAAVISPPYDMIDPIQAHRLGSIMSYGGDMTAAGSRSEEHTSELQSRSDLVCRLLLEKKKKRIPNSYNTSYIDV